MRPLVLGLLLVHLLFAGCGGDASRPTATVGADAISTADRDVVSRFGTQIDKWNAAATDGRRRIRRATGPKCFASNPAISRRYSVLRS
jgi:hypothetical protein